MSSHKCHIKQNANYEVKQRYIPTFVHEPIFYEQPPRPSTSRCTPTFHSTVFDTEGYNIKTIHEKRQYIERPVVASQNNVQVQQAIVEKVIPRNLLMNTSTDKWFDHTKQQILLSIKDCNKHGYSKERKYVDLSSDPVFTDYNYGAKVLENVSTISNYAGNIPKGHIHHQVVPHQQKIEKEIQVARPKENVVQYVPPKEKVTFVPEETKENPPILEQQAPKVQTISKPTKPQKQQLKLKGRQIPSRPQTVNKSRTIQQKPTFTVVRKNRNHQ